MNKREEYITKYKSFRQLTNGEKPLKKDFLKYCEINENQLIRAFGKDSYSTLQQECGDKPNKLEMERTSMTQILEQYGQLIRKHKRPVNTSDWTSAGFRPNVNNLREVHNLKWSDMRYAFLQHYSEDFIWKGVVEILNPDNAPSSNKQDKKFHEIVDKINAWTPDRRRVLEEGYKIELRKYLEKYFNVEEEVGDSNADLLLNKKYPIEIKKDPSLSEYDRLLGQMIRALTEQELQTIADKSFSAERMNYVKDIFLFSCYTGLAYIDVKQLRRDEIATGIDGEKWIFTKRQKTETPTRIPLLPMALEIMNRYKDHAQCCNKGYVLPVLSNQKMNSYLKEIADACGINKNLTFHIARHTFATTVTLSNGVPIETVSKMLGHKSLKQTQHYAKILDIKISEDMKALKSRLADLIKR